MSVNFREPPNPEALAQLKKVFGEPVATDGKSFLYDRTPTLHQRTMGDLARTAGQPVDVELHAEGEIKTLADGTRYEATPCGWRRIR